MAQLNYDYGTAKGVAGGKVDISFDEVITRMNEVEDGVLKFGMAVVVGTKAGNTVKKPAATSDKFEGVVVCHANTEQDMNGNVVVKKGASLGVMTKGHIWGRLATGVTPAYGEKAYAVVTGNDAGTFTNVADGALETGATFGKYTDGELAVIVLK